MHAFLGRHWRQRIGFGIRRNKLRLVFCSEAKAASAQQGSAVQLPNRGWTTAPSHGHCMIIRTPARTFFSLFLSFSFFFFFPLMKFLLNCVWTKDHSGITFKPKLTMRTKAEIHVWKCGYILARKIHGLKVNPVKWALHSKKENPKKNKEITRCTPQ